MTQDRVFALLKELTGQKNVISVPRLFLRALNGDLATALVLSQCVYWSGRNGTDWNAKSYPEWGDETGLSKYQVGRAADKLRGIGLLETTVKKFKNTPTVHYKVNQSNLEIWIIKFLDSKETSLSDSEETLLSDSEETLLSIGKKLDYLNTYTTAQSTTKNTKTHGKLPLSVPVVHPSQDTDFFDAFPDEGLPIEEGVTKKSETPKTGGSRKPSDPLLKHPAIVAYRTEIRYHVPVTWRKQVAATIGDNPTQVERWAGTIHEWVGRGYNPTNVKGMLEVYTGGGFDEAGKRKSAEALRANLPPVFEM